MLALSRVLELAAVFSLGTLVAVFVLQPHVHEASDSVLNERRLESTQRKVFFDFGSNDGSSIEFFFDSAFSNDKLEIQGGTSSSVLRGRGAETGWEVVAVEANPRFTPKLDALKQRLLREAKVGKFHLYTSTALASNDGNITFYFDTPEGDAGASIIKDSHSVKGGKNITVRALDVHTLFRDELGISARDYVVVKMDIEGAEFEMMRRILSHGLLRYVDVLAVEWHDVNDQFTGYDPATKQFYTQKRECLQWVIDGAHKLVQENWG
jgi:FkbM family methyltransferase